MKSMTCSARAEPRRWRELFAPAGVAMLLLWMSLGVAQAAARFSFAVIGDVPFSTSEEASVNDMLLNIESSRARFVIHVGGIKGPGEPCSDDLFDLRRSLLNSIQKPLVYLPGHNEWSVCGQPAAGAYDPAERLNRLRQIFFADDESLGQDRINVIRESSLARFRSYPENMRWQTGPVLFVTLNVPGNNNNYNDAAGRNGEFDDRLFANRTWLERSFHYADQEGLKGIVIALQADPQFNIPLKRPDPRARNRDGYYELKLHLRDLTAKFNGQVLLVHGDTPGFRHDQPLNGSDGKLLKNFTRVEGFASPQVSNWINITVDPAYSRLFRVSPVIPEPFPAEMPATTPAGVSGRK